MSFGIKQCVCPPSRNRISLGGESNALYPVAHCYVKVFRGDSADQVFKAQELEPCLHHAGSDVDHLRCHLVADRSRNELHGAAGADSHPVHVLQLRLSHLLVDGVLLHPVFRRRNSSTDCFRVSFALLFDPSTSRAL